MLIFVHQLPLLHSIKVTLNFLLPQEKLKIFRNKMLCKNAKMQVIKTVI